VHAHTDGLPLFVAIVIDTLLGTDPDAGPRPSLSLSAGTALPVPEDLAGAVEARIARLPADTVALLQAAAICGVEFRAGAVAEVLGISYENAIEICDRLVRQQYWLRHVATIDLTDGTLDSLYSFRHAIYQHVFYERQGVAQRAQQHRRVARALAAGAEKGVPVVPAEHALHYERGREIAPALRAYSSAAQSALRSFAPHAAAELCEHALTLLKHVPQGPDRLMLELGIQGPRGIAAAQLHGVGSHSSRAVFERVRELCELLPQHPARALVLNGYGASLFSRGEYAKLQELAEQLDRLEGPDREALSVMTSLFRAGAAAARGQCRAATQLWQQAIAHCEAITDRGRFAPFVVDPETGVRANAVRTFFERGLIDRAREESAKAVAMSHQLGQPLGMSLAHWRAGMLEVRLGDPLKVLEHADAIRDIVAKTTVSQGDGPSRYLRGWALAQRGDPQQGLQLIREGLERHLRIGMIASSTEVMGYAAEALILAGDWSGAARQLAEAFARARELDELVHLPMLLMLQGQVAHGMGDMPAAYRWLREAVRVAREQEAAGFELKAACELAEHPDATDADRQALARLLNGLEEGRDTPDYQRGVALT
jgi:tetratricopeptide (TPR) repeat protein